MGQVVTITRDAPGRDLSHTLEARGPFEPFTHTRRDALAAYNAFRALEGFGPASRYTTEPTGNTKLSHAARPVVSLTLAPYTRSGLQVCAASTTGCRFACVLGTECGRALFDSRIIRARSVRTRFLDFDPQSAVDLVAYETEAETYVRAGGRAVARRRVALRPNAGSDLRWERIAPRMFEVPWIDGYDYTKRADRFATGRYNLIMSAHEHDTRETLERKLATGPLALVADIAKGAPLPRYMGLGPWGPIEVFEGDSDDYRNATRPAGSVIILALKGSNKAKEHARRRGFARSLAAWERILSG